MPLGSARVGMLGSGVAIPDTSMFQNPIYQWWAAEGIEVNDGTEATDWTDQVATLTASAAQGSPTYRSNQSGFEAVEYDGNDGHNWTPDSALPTGTSGVSAVALFFVPSSATGIEICAGHDTVNFGRDGGSYATVVQGGDNAVGGSVPIGQWDTVGYSYDGSEFITYGGGSSVASVSRSPSLSATDGAIGYRKNTGDFFLSGFVAEVVYSANAEPASTFSAYHNDRLS